MHTLTWILLASVAGGALSVLCAGLLTLTASSHLVPVLVSYAIGALLGASFLEVLPEAIERTGSAETTAAVVLAGILGFFILEKLVLWRHCHHESCEAHDPHAHDHGHGHGHGRSRSGTLIIIGDTFHNFVDGILMAAAFMADTQLGIVTALAIVAHEIPQEVGDFVILLHSGYSKRAALLFNLLSSAATVAGAALAWFALQGMQGAVGPLLAIAGASMIYVAVADLIPDLHRRPEIGATLQQVLLIVLGIGSIWGIGHLIGH